VADESTNAEVPWYAPGYAAATLAQVCKPRPRERLWTLVKAGSRIDAELLFQAEDGVEIQFLHQGVMAYAHRCVFPHRRSKKLKKTDSA